MIVRAEVSFAKRALYGIHVARATRVDHARAIAHDDVLVPNAEPLVVRRGGDGGGAGAREHHAHVLDALADDLERVHERRARR